MGWSTTSIPAALVSNGARNNHKHPPMASTIASRRSQRPESRGCKAPDPAAGFGEGVPIALLRGQVAGDGSNRERLQEGGMGRPLTEGPLTLVPGDGFHEAVAETG